MSEQAPAPVPAKKPRASTTAKVAASGSLVAFITALIAAWPTISAMLPETWSSKVTPIIQQVQKELPAIQKTLEELESQLGTLKAIDDRLKAVEAKQAEPPKWTPEQQKIVEDAIKAAVEKHTPPKPEPQPGPTPTPEPSALKLILSDQLGKPVSATTVTAGRLFMVTATGATADIKWHAVSSGDAQIGLLPGGLGHSLVLGAEAWAEFVAFDRGAQASMRITANHGPQPPPKPDDETVPKPSPEPAPKPTPQPLGLAPQCLGKYGLMMADAFAAAADQFDKGIDPQTIMNDMGEALKPARIESTMPLMKRLNELRASRADSAKELRMWATQLRAIPQVPQAAAGPVYGDDFKRRIDILDGIIRAGGGTP